MARLYAHFCLRSGVRMGLKVTQTLWKKNSHFQQNAYDPYNMLKPMSYRLTCLMACQFIKIPCPMARLYAHFCLRSGVRMGLKVTEGIIRTT